MTWPAASSMASTASLLWPWTSRMASMAATTVPRSRGSSRFSSLYLQRTVTWSSPCSMRRSSRPALPSACSSGPGAAVAVAQSSRLASWIAPRMAYLAFSCRSRGIPAGGVPFLPQ